MRRRISALVTAGACGFAAAQPCTPDFIDEPPLYEYKVLHQGMAMTTFDDGRGSAVYAGLGGQDSNGARILRLTGPDTPEPVGLGVAGLDSYSRTMRVLDLDGAGGEPPKLYAAGGFLPERVWRYDGDQWESLPDPLPPFGRDVWDMAEFDDGSGGALYVTGDFGTHLGLRYGDGPHALARWDAATEKWATVGGGLWREGGGEEIGRVMAVFDKDGSGPKAPALFVGGLFNRAGGLAVTSLVRWDGAEFSAVGELKRDDGKPVTVTELFVHDDGSGEALYIGGMFHEAGGAGGAGGVRSPGLVRWDGERFTDVGGGLPPSGGHLNQSWARTLSTWREGGRDLLMVGGSWLRTDPAFRGPLVLWDGAEWRPLMADGREIGALILDALAVFEDGRQVVYVAGSFKELDGRFIEGVARWDGERWSGYDKGLGGGVRRLAVFGDGAGPKLILAPQKVIHDRFVRGLASWDGAELAEYPIAGIPGDEIPPHGWAVASRAGQERLYFRTRGGPVAAGTGTSDLIWEFDGERAVQIAEVNARKARTMGELHVFEYDDGAGPAMHIAGDFHDVEGAVLGEIVKWEGGRWVGLGEGIRFNDGSAGAGDESVIVFDDGNGPALYVGGKRMWIGGEETPGGLARWDGKEWEGSVGDYALPAPIPGHSWDLEVYQGKLHAILALEHPGGSILPGVARLDGEHWTVLGLTNPDPAKFGLIEDLHVFDDGSGAKLYAIGVFAELGGVAARGGAIWDGERWEPMSGGFDPLIGLFPPEAMAVYDAGDGPDLYTGGGFGQVTDATGQVIPTGRLARWRGCRDSCPADLTGDGALDFADFMAFQTLFAAMDPRADFDGDGAFTFFDFLTYQDAFAAGCP